MSQSIEALMKAIECCTVEERKSLWEFLKARVPRHPLEIEWAIDGEDVLSSLHRSSDLSKRGVRGLIAELMFDRDILPSVRANGWKPVSIPKGDWPYDSLVEKEGRQVRIQIKLQRLQAGEPKRFWQRFYPRTVYYDVEVQKTRSGKKRSSKKSAAVEPELLATLASTRPYAFGAFDILAVNMQPSTKRWSDFRFTVANWLLERPGIPSLIEIHQPVALVPDDTWTDDLGTCLAWLQRGEDRKVLKEILHRRSPRVPEAPTG